MRRAVALLILGSLAACRPAPAPSAPRVERARASTPAELLPDDLDFVVRIGAARIRQNPALAGVVRNLAPAQPSDLLASMKAAFGEAEAVWAGTRWMSDGFHGDGVVAIDVPPGGDDFARATPESRSWRPLAIAVRDVEAFERAASARGEPVLQVVMKDGGIVLATAAEADAVLRVLRSGPDESRLDPPARGLVSFAGRLRGSPPLDAAARGMLHGLTEGLLGYAGSLEEAGGAEEAGPGAVEVEASLTYASASHAARAAERAKETTERLAAAGGAVGTMAHSVKLREVGSSLQVRAKVPFAWLARLH
jgi:hypothetical protein